LQYTSRILSYSTHGVLNLADCAMNQKTPSTLKKATANNRVRIIGGQWRSRILTFPTASGLRPSGDRVRETLFNWLGQTLHGQACLDVYAGSGALGFEAASRGAKTVTMIESSTPVYAALEHNRSLLAATNCQLLRGEALLHLKKLESQKALFDTVFIDPPFASNLLEPTLAALPPLLNAYARVYVEWASALPDALVGEAGLWKVEKSSRAGVVHFALLSLK
jgi:16S rRNA (guanine966-N2)-methyltransferase